MADDPKFKLRDVARLTGTPLPTLKRWVREDTLPHEHVGPTKRVRVRQSVVVQFFGILTDTSNPPS